jgi:hypothetical protein
VENPIGPYLLAPSQAPAPQYLLDGRQRMTTLYAALAASFWTREEKAPPSPAPDVSAAPDGTPWSILFDLDEEDFVFDPPETSPNLSLFRAGEDKNRALLPLAVLLDDTAYDEVFSMAWARSRGTALVLADQKPRAGDNRPFDDPFALIAHGSENIGMLIAQGAEGIQASVRKQITHKHLATALRAPANRALCPPHELPRLREALFRDACPEAILCSHLVDKAAHDALVRGDLETFFERRRAAILDAEKRWVETRGGEEEILREPRTYAQG